MKRKNHQKLAVQLRSGKVYRREMLLLLSKAVDRDLMTLVIKGKLEKIAPGLYYKPVQSQFGSLPPKDKEVVQTFLRDKDFLIYSWNQYNTLGLGLTQLYNRLIVYNKKRHGIFKLGNKIFDFRRPARGFPKKITKEFLLVDLINNHKELSEDIESMKLNINNNLNRFNHKKLLEITRQYGKIACQKFFEEIFNQQN